MAHATPQVSNDGLTFSTGQILPPGSAAQTLFSQFRFSTISK
jgi:hypothetical protein